MQSTEPKSFLDKNNTYISIGILLVMLGGTWIAAGVANQAEANQQAIRDLSMSITNTPTRAEFDALKDDVKEIKAGINKITDYIIVK